MLFILGLLDILAGVTLFSIKFFPVLLPIALLFAFYLIGKSIAYFKTFASVVDIFVGIIMIIAVFDIYNLFTYLSILWLLQKGILSLF